MSLRIVILNSAQHDLKELKAYLVNNFSIKTWHASYNKIKEAVRNLASFPYAGSIPEEIDKLNLTQHRQVLSGMNRIIYEVRQDVIYIHMVIDARRDMSSLLIRRLLRMT